MRRAMRLPPTRTPASEPQLEPDPRSTVGRSRRTVDVADLVGQIGIGDITRRWTTTAPFVVTRARDIQNPAGHRDVEAVSGKLLDQPEPYFGRTFSRAK